MALQGSGAISLSELATEFNDTQPNNMSEFYRGGDRVPSVNTTVPTAGLINLTDFYNCVNEIGVTASNATNVSLASAFSSNWTVNVPKRYTVPNGVTIGGTGGTAAITCESNMAGTLIIEVTGSVIGTGGAAGGAGGDAISNAVGGVTLTVNNNGLVAGGGGGGGTGGVGGNGSYSSTSDQTLYNINNYWWYGTYANGTYFRWGSVLRPHNNQTVVTYGGATYYRGTYQQDVNYYAFYSIRRVATSTVNTTGGSGGAGGAGQGYNQNNTSGSAGASGGTNAGAGGTGGSGGTYANAGGTGGTGANGNASNGSAGSSGGAAGAAVSGTALAAYTNNGTVNGTVAT